jgi:peptide/nickel transport system ATP-binding protein
VVAHYADEVAVMYAGRIVEAAPVRELFAQPAHPYTQGLLASLPARQRGGARRLHAIRGQVASPLQAPPGCAFAPRCDFASEACNATMPALREAGPGRLKRCVLDAPKEAMAASPARPPAGAHTAARSAEVSE